MDWNEDGKKDLILGEYDGYIRIYLNTNTDESPVFSGYENLQQGGADFDCGDYSLPRIVDWNNDGKKDVLCGNKEGKIWLLINTGTNALPLFNSQVYIQDSGLDLDVGERCSPTIADWNRDGKKDLLCGEMEGTILYFENTGTDAAPQFNGSSQLMIGPDILDVGFTSRPETVDWDGDGVADLVCGEATGFMMFYHALGPLSIDANTLSQSGGGTIGFAVNAGPAYAGRPYFLLGSGSGTSPGTALPGGALLPLNYDSVLAYIVSHYNNAVFASFRGVLDAAGEATALLNAPGSIPLPVASILHFAYTTENPYDFQSNPAAVEIVP